MESNIKKCLIIYNPNSGKAISKDILAIYRNILKERGYKVDIFATKHKNHATEVIYNAENYNIVFSLGGDGTLNEVVRGNYYRKNKLTICPLPSGTCNDVSTMLGYGKNPIDNINMALNGVERDYDIGTINDNPFVYVVGMGKLTNIPYETKSENKKKSGYMAYIKEGLIEIFNQMKRYSAEVEVDGIKINGLYSLIMVSNADHIAGISNFHKDVCLDDGEMEVLLCKSSSKRSFIKSFLKYFLGKNTDDIISLKAHDVSIKVIDKLDKNWCIDGEKFEYFGNEYNIKVSSKMKLLTPKQKKKNLFSVNI